MLKTLLLFQSTRQVIRGEKLLLAGQVHAVVIPVPRSISPECGMALEVEEQQLATATKILKNAGIDAAVHKGEYRK